MRVLEVYSHAKRKREQKLQSELTQTRAELEAIKARVAELEQKVGRVK